MTASRPALAPGDVVLCEVVFTDYSDVKTRPVIVLSVKEYEGGGEDVVVLALTSRVDAPHRYKCSINADDPEFGATGLKRSSAVLCSKILTVHWQNLRRRLGRLSSSQLEHVRSLVSEVLSV
jgi:mRNA-degrading endonuclease toxin of MazEF toxin-antitoxin module